MILLVIGLKRLPSSGPRAADPTRQKPAAEADHLSTLQAVLDPG
jgi:hypothetical protein